MKLQLIRWIISSKREARAFFFCRNLSYILTFLFFVLKYKYKTLFYNFGSRLLTDRKGRNEEEKEERIAGGFRIAFSGGRLLRNYGLQGA